MENNRFIKLLNRAQEEKNAVGAVNVFNYITAAAAIEAADEINKNVIIQTSMGTVKYYGPEKLFGMIDSIRKSAKVEVAIHLDHCTDMELAKKCIMSGWDSVMVDFSRLALEENIHNTREIVHFAHANGVAVEGEVGVIAGVEDEIVSDKSVDAGYEETLRFIDETGVDAIAPAVGTAHGVYKGTPKINYELVKRLGQYKTPVVIHGGTGLSAETFLRLIDLGARKINISTVVKQAYLGKIKELANSDGKCNPIEFDDEVKTAVKEEIKKHLEVFSKMRHSF